MGPAGSACRKENLVAGVERGLRRVGGLLDWKGTGCGTTQQAAGKGLVSSRVRGIFPPGLKWVRENRAFLATERNSGRWVKGGCMEKQQVGVRRGGQWQGKQVGAKIQFSRRH